MCIRDRHMVVQNSAQQVVGSGDGVHIAGEVQVDVLHRNDLCIAAAGSAALDAEYRTQGCLLYTSTSQNSMDLYR